MRKTQWQLLNEFSESAIQKIVKKFSNESDEQTIRSYIDNFEKYKNGIQKKDPFQYSSFMEFEQAVDAAKGKSEFKKRNLADKGKPKEFINKQEESSEAIADDEDVTIFKGDEEHKCVKYGKGYSFCISRHVGGNMFGSYRLQKASTFYFIFFKKVPKSDPKHIMVLDRTTNGWEWTFADNATKQIQGGFEEVSKNFPVLKKYKSLFVNIPLSDKEREILQTIKKFNAKQSLEIFQNVDYETKVQLVKSGIKLDDDIFKTLDKNLRNDYISVGGNITKYQADNLSDSEISRYRNVRKMTIPQLLENNIYKPSKLDYGLSESVDIAINNEQISINYENSKGRKIQKDFDTNGNMIHYKVVGGIEEWWIYNDKGKLISYRDSFDQSHELEYYDNGEPKSCHYKKFDDEEKLIEYDVDGKLKLSYVKLPSGFETWDWYGKSGQIIHHKNSRGEEWWKNQYGRTIPDPNLKKESLNNNMLTQRDLLSEGFWRALAKGAKKTLQTVAPELTDPIEKAYDKVKGIKDATKEGWLGPEGVVKKNLQKQGYEVGRIQKIGKNRWQANVKEITYDDVTGAKTLGPNKVKVVSDDENIRTSSNPTSRSGSSNGTGIYSYNGKSYMRDNSKQAVQNGQNWEVPAYLVDSQNNRISNSNNTLVVDQRGIVKSLR